MHEPVPDAGLFTLMGATLFLHRISSASKDPVLLMHISTVYKYGRCCKK